MKTTIRNSIGGLLLIPLVLVCFGLSPAARAVVPAPDGGYPGFNTAEGQNPLLNLAGGVWNTAIGAQALHQDTTGNVNTAVGLNALYFNNGSANVAVGSQTLQSNGAGNNNNAVGNFALFGNSAGNGNAAVGHQALFNSTASGNTAVGFRAGSTITSGFNNVSLGNGAGNGTTTANHNIAIGVPATGPFANLSFTCWIGSIHGLPTSNAASTLPVQIDSNNVLGTSASSRRYKHDIKPMDKASEAILALKPVTFKYNSDDSGTTLYGLIAEDVVKVNPNLVAYRGDEVYSVKYDQVNAMLLNEFLKEHKKVEEQQASISQLKSEMQTMVAQLKEQTAQIQKVSAQIQVNKPAPQVVANKP